MFLLPFRSALKSTSCRLINDVNLRYSHNVNKQTKEKPPPKVSPEVMNYIDSTSEYAGFKEEIPKHLLRKYKNPESMYLINRSTAKVIVDTVEEKITRNVPIVEVNPGLGFLTEELLKVFDNKIYLYESSPSFTKPLNKLQGTCPDKISVQIADFFGMWKLHFKDKMDQGNRIDQLLGDLATNDKGRKVSILGAMPSLSFVKHLIYNIVFYNTTDKLGRPDLYIIMPGHHYEFLTDETIQKSKHKSIPALFQVLFNFQLLRTVPRFHFLPWIHLPTSKGVTMLDEFSLYLVNISQKDELPCPPEYLPLLWYFFKPQVFSKTTRVIPMLEQWIPGCGIWIITGQDPPDTNKRLSPGPNDAPLPHMTIFTEFGDLSLKQKITVFKKFISWPEFEHCQFRVTMENNLPKVVSQVEDDNKDTIATHMDEIDSDTDNEPDEKL